MRRSFAALLFVSGLLNGSPAHADGFVMTKGQWWDGGSGQCAGPVEVKMTGWSSDARVQWRESAMDAWRELAIERFVPEAGRFSGTTSDRTVSIQGFRTGGEIAGSITFYQRGRDYRFVLR